MNDSQQPARRGQGYGATVYLIAPMKADRPLIDTVATREIITIDLANHIDRVFIDDGYDFTQTQIYCEKVARPPIAIDRTPRREDLLEKIRKRQAAGEERFAFLLTEADKSALDELAQQLTANDINPVDIRQPY